MFRIRPSYLRHVNLSKRHYDVKISIPFNVDLVKHVHVLANDLIKDFIALELRAVTVEPAYIVHSYKGFQPKRSVFDWSQSYIPILLSI